MYSIMVDDEILYHPMLASEGLAVSSATVTVEMDKTGSAEITVPCVNPEVTRCSKMTAMIRFMDDDKELFRGRILNDDRDFYNNKTMYIEGELAFMLDHILSPYNAAIIRQLWNVQFQNDYGRLFNGTVGDYFRYYVSVYNSQSDNNRKFKVGEVTALGASVDIDALIRAYEEQKQADPDNTPENEDIIKNYEYPNIWDEINNKLIERYGGHIRTRCESSIRLGGLSSTYSIANIEDTGVFAGSDRRIATSGFIDITNEYTIKYSIKEGYWLGVFYYSAANESNFVGYQHWLTGSGTLTKLGNYMRICISTVNDTEYLTPEDCSNVKIWSVKTELADNPAIFQLGSITDSGAYQGSDKRIVTPNYIDIRTEDWLTYTVEDGYWLGVFYYSEPNESHFVSYQHWLTGFGQLTIPIDSTTNTRLGNYVRIVITTVNDTDILAPAACKYVSITKRPTRYIDWIENYSTQTTQTIEFGENLLDFSEHIDADELMTCLIPLGKTQEDETQGRVNITSVNGGKLYVENDTAVRLFGRIWKTQTWEEETNPQTLKTLGEAYLAAHCSAAANITINAVDLAFTGADVEKIHVGDWIIVESPPHGIAEPVQCLKIVYDLLAPDKTEYTFNSIQKTITEQNSKSYTGKRYATKSEVKAARAQAEKASKDAAKADSKAGTASTAAENANSKADTADTKADTALGNVEAIDEKVNNYSNYFTAADIGQDFDLVAKLNQGAGIDEILDAVQPKLFEVDILDTLKNRFGINLDANKIQQLESMLSNLGLDINILGEDGTINYDAILSLVTAKLGWVGDALSKIVGDIKTNLGLNIDLSNIWQGRISSGGGGGGGGGVNAQE